MKIMFSVRKSLSITCLILLMAAKLNATHLMGGELTYEHDGSISNETFYTVKLIVYRYCDNSNGQTAPLDPDMFLGVYVNDPSNPSGPLNWFNTETMILINSSFVTAAAGNSNCPFQPTACIERGEYILTILLPDNPLGYHLFVERCCRNGNIVNLVSPGAAGMTYYAFIPPAIINSTPQIADISVPYICTGDTVTIINNAFDPDGDSLAYSFVIPYNGNSSPSDPKPDPVTIDPYLLPITDVIFSPGYSQLNFFGPGGYASIDPITGLTKYFIPNQGFYAAAIEIREYRNGVLISSIRRDIQFIAITCTPNSVPVIAAASSGGVYSVPEGQQICFFVTATDADGDSLYLNASGQLLNGAVTNPPGTIANAAGVGTVSSQFCWTPVCGMSRPAPYQFSVTISDNGCPQKTSSQIFSVYVTAGASSLTPTVSITQSPPGILCQGSNVTFHSNATLPGTAPQFTWYINGVAVPGINDSVFSPTTLNNGDLITVSLISNATCLVTNTASSLPFVANVNPQPAPQVTITSNPSGNLCPQQIAIFTANVTNAGAAPFYQWNINGNPSGTNQPAFTAANPSGVITVFVTVTPTTGCPPQNSNTIVFNIKPTITPQILMSANVTDSICPGEQVIFTVTSSTTGNLPEYNWLVNGVNQWINNDTLILTSINDGDEVNVSVTSSYPCLSPTYTYAVPLRYYIYPPLAADLTDGPLEICSGLPVTLEMNTVGGKSSTYIYNWSYGSSLSAINTLIPVTSGYYYATVDDYCYSPIIDSMYIEVLPVPTADFYFSPERPSVFNPDVQFTDRSTNAIIWNWDLGEQIFSSLQHPFHQYQTTGIFQVQLIVTNDVGCNDTLVKNLEVENYITVYIPNSFTPNGDGKNDEFGMIGFSTGGYSMSIFNRWGQEIFSSNGAYDTWKGTDKDGKRVPSGTYMYLIYVNNDTSKKPHSGILNLIR